MAQITVRYVTSVGKTAQNADFEIQAKAVACKSYRNERSKEDFQKELNNLSYLKEALIEGAKDHTTHRCNCSG